VKPQPKEVRITCRYQKMYHSLFNDVTDLSQGSSRRSIERGNDRNRPEPSKPRFQAAEIKMKSARQRHCIPQEKAALPRRAIIIEVNKNC
jgi:hypothetical protein